MAGQSVSGLPVTVIGMGMCGSNVTLELSAAIGPVEASIKLPNSWLPFSMGLKLDFNKVLTSDWRTLFSRAFSMRGDPLRVGNIANFDFYIGDMNAQNQNFMRLLIEKEIIDALSESPDITFDKMSEQFRHSHKIITETDYDNAKKVLRRAREVGILSFKRGATDLLFSDGSGGLQFASEMLAKQDDQLYENIKAYDEGTAVGIFSCGGGTGAGSIFGLLRRIKSRGRYTIGVAVMPGVNEGQIKPRAGRFLARYFGEDPAKRFDSVFFVSNLAAMTAASYQASEFLQSHSVDEAKADSDSTFAKDPISGINWYIQMYLLFYAMKERQITKVLFGKAMDANDGRSYLSGASIVGMSSARKFRNERKPMDLFVDALSPVDFAGGILSGLSTEISNNYIESVTVRKLLHELKTNVMASVDANRFDADFQEHRSLGQKIESLSRFYPTIKRVVVSFYTPTGANPSEVLACQKYLMPFLDALTGGTVLLQAYYYQGEYVECDTVQVLGSVDKMIDG